MSKKRVLIIDDEVGFTRLLKMNLEKTGDYEVMVENKSTKAVLAARLFHPNVILLDVVMPDMDGGDVAAQLQADSHLSKIPIIMLTALVDGNEISPGAVAQSGTMNVLSKPIDLELLLQCLKDAIEAGEAQQG